MSQFTRKRIAGVFFLFACLLTLVLGVLAVEWSLLFLAVLNLMTGVAFLVEARRCKAKARAG